MATRDHDEIQQKYKDLWSWHGTQAATRQFINYKMEGYLKKFVKQVRIFQRSLYPKRYFVIDFTIAKIFVKQDKSCTIGPKEGSNSKVKVIPFRSIKDCYLSTVKLDKSTVPKNWQNVFYVQTIERLYVLCAKNEEDLKMWMAGFKYIISSTSTVQQIMHHND